MRITETAAFGPGDGAQKYPTDSWPGLRCGTLMVIFRPVRYLNAPATKSQVAGKYSGWSANTQIRPCPNRPATQDAPPPIDGKSGLHEEVCRLALNRAATKKSVAPSTASPGSMTGPPLKRT